MTKTAGAALSLPANFSIAAALAQGLLSMNTQVVTVSGVAVVKGSTVAALISTGVLNPSLPASALGFSGGPQYGGD
jgi:hypothetical protein